MMSVIRAKIPFAIFSTLLLARKLPSQDLSETLPFTSTRSHASRMPGFFRHLKYRPISLFNNQLSHFFNLLIYVVCWPYAGHLWPLPPFATANSAIAPARASPAGHHRDAQLSKAPVQCFSAPHGYWDLAT
jgi:hypothetical protein